VRKRCFCVFPTKKKFKWWINENVKFEGRKDGRNDGMQEGRKEGRKKGSM